MGDRDAGVRDGATPDRIPRNRPSPRPPRRTSSQHRLVIQPQPRKVDNHPGYCNPSSSYNPVRLNHGNPRRQPREAAAGAPGHRTPIRECSESSTIDHHADASETQCDQCRARKVRIFLTCSLKHLKKMLTTFGRSAAIERRRVQTVSTQESAAPIAPSRATRRRLPSSGC